MKLLVIPSWYPPEGVRFFDDQTKWLMKEGFEASIIAAEEKSLKSLRFGTILDDFRIKRRKEHDILTYRHSQLRIPKLNRLNTLIWIRIALYLTEKFIKENGKPDIIHVHSSMWGGCVAARIKKKYHIPYVITEHRGRFNENNFTKEKDILPWYRPLLKVALLNADAIIPVSHLQISILENIAQQKLNCIAIPNPVDEKLFIPTDQKESRSTVTNYLNISNFLPYKAIDILVKAFNDALKSENNLQLHLVGKGPGLNFINELVHQYGITDKVHFYGLLSSEEVKKRIQAVDFLILSSYNEGQPVVIGETVLCGKPVIATDIISREDVPSFVGYIVPTGNIEALTQAILLAHNEKKNFDPVRIRDFALNRFSHVHVIPAIIKVLESVKK
jgi:L-malate glycosyltransferase